MGRLSRDGQTAMRTKLLLRARSFRPPKPSSEADGVVHPAGVEVGVGVCVDGGGFVGLGVGVCVDGGGFVGLGVGVCVDVEGSVGVDVGVKVGPGVSVGVGV
jgi:hypothetical protein